MKLAFTDNFAIVRDNMMMFCCRNKHPPIEDHSAYDAWYNQWKLIIMKYKRRNSCRKYITIR